jgi:hypothetical protein
MSAPARHAVRPCAPSSCAATSSGRVIVMVVMLLSPWSAVSDCLQHAAKHNAPMPYMIATAMAPFASHRHRPGLGRDDHMCTANSNKYCPAPPWRPPVVSVSGLAWPAGPCYNHAGNRRGPRTEVPRKFLWFPSVVPLAGEGGKVAAQQHFRRFGPYRFDGASGQLWRHPQLSGVGFWGTRVPAVERFERRIILLLG